MYTNHLVLFLFFIIVMYFVLPKQSEFGGQTPMSTPMKCVFYGLLLWFIVLVATSTESFHFEVTPWKKTCGQPHPFRCQGCCLPGFNGQPIHFEYTGDEERMNVPAAGGCPMTAMLKNHSNDYSSLANTGDYIPIGTSTEEIVEGYEDCGCA